MHFLNAAMGSLLCFGVFVVVVAAAVLIRSQWFFSVLYNFRIISFLSLL